MPTDHNDGPCRDDGVVSAVQVGQLATGEREHDTVPVSEDGKPAATPEGQEQVAAVTEELAAAGVTVRWR